MNIQDIRTLYAYNRWANRRLLATASRLLSEDLSRDLNASFGSVRGTLLHILWGDWGWLRFFQDGSFMAEPTIEDFPDVAALETFCTDLEQGQQVFVEGLTDERLAGPCAIRGHEYTLGDLIQHVLNHSTYHRGQVVLMLRQLGQTPPATDYNLFLREA